MAGDEEAVLREFQGSASADSLRRLLLAHQNRIYTLCLQVLGRAEDAEDAAQEVLLKLADGARTARNADALRGWIYRVALRSSINALHRRNAIRHRESRSAMSPPPASAFDDRERHALFEAIEGLAEGDRSLLFEHYFEKVPLEKLGENRGVSAVAIWKRIDRVREKLKKTLLAGGFIAASDRVTQALECTAPAAAPPPQLLEGALTKILAGGLAVGVAKSSIAPLILVVVALIFVLGAGGYAALRTGAPVRAVIPEAKTAVEPPFAETRSESHVPVPVFAQNSTAPPKQNRLREMLERYKAKHRLAQATFSMDEEAPILVGSRVLIFEDPRTFLDFIRDPANEDLCEELIGDALRLLRVVDGVTIQSGQKFAEFPDELTNGFLEILRSGGSTLKRSLLQFLLIVGGASEEFNLQYLHLIHDADPGVQGNAIGALSQGRVLPPEMLEQLRQVYETSSDRGVRSMALDAISKTDTEEIQQWMVARLDRDRDAGVARFVAKASLNVLLARAGSLDEKLFDRHASALKAAAMVPMDRHAYYDLVLAAVNLPANRSLAVLETALPQAPTPKLSKAVTKLMEVIRSGPSTWNSLMIEFQSLAKD